MRTLQGLSLIFKGKIPEAVEELRIVVDNDPQNVLARSALIGACVQSGDWLFVVDAADALRDAVPQTDCERLMVAWATDSLPDIEDLIKKRPSWVATTISQLETRRSLPTPYLIVELESDAMANEAGTTFGTLLAFFRKKSTTKTTFANGGTVVNDGEWIWGLYKHRQYARPRLRDFAELIFEPWVGDNTLTPSIDPITRQLVVDPDNPKKTRRLAAGCLFMSRFVTSTPRAAIITDEWRRDADLTSRGD